MNQPERIHFRINSAELHNTSQTEPAPPDGLSIDEQLNESTSAVFFADFVLSVATGVTSTLVAKFVLSYCLARGAKRVGFHRKREIEFVDLEEGKILRIIEEIRQSDD